MRAERSLEKGPPRDTLAEGNCGPYARQLMMVLDGLGLETIDPLTQEDFSALPMPEGVWDG